VTPTTKILLADDGLDIRCIAERVDRGQRSRYMPTMDGQVFAK
jgi:hypothetical protein